MHVRTINRSKEEIKVKSLIMSRSKQPLAIKKAEEEEDLIEDVLIDDCNNFVGLKVTYGSTQVTNRCRLTSDQTNDRPIVEIRGDANSFYTLVGTICSNLFLTFFFLLS